MQKFYVFILLFLWCTPSVRAQTREAAAFDQSKFVPDIAFILDVSGVARNIADQRFYSLEIPGFSFPVANPTGSSGLNAHRGLNFNYGELSIFSVVDPYFDLFAVLSLSPESAGLEEAYVTTRKLPYGFQLKVGKFLASFGRINEQHEHYWDFADRPLIATAIFGEEGLNEIGAQVTWVAPTTTYLMIGAEVLNGENEQSFGTTGISDPNGQVSLQAVQGPDLAIGFIRSSFDIENASVLLGVSNAWGGTRIDQGFSTSEGGGHAVDAQTDIIGGDLTVKYSLDAIRYLSFQTEYMYRMVSGTVYSRDSIAVASMSLDKHHSGFYAQCVVKLDQLWRAGVRYDRILQNEVTLETAGQQMPSALTRLAAMIEYSPTEFSRIRLQVERDESLGLQALQVWTMQPYTQLILQANFTIGAHGAHAF